MTDEICIEWILEESQINESEVPEGSITQLATMTLEEEVREILIPLNHPIGAASLQVIGLGTTYEYVIYFSQNNKKLLAENNVGYAFCCLLPVFVIVAFICWKYWLPKQLTWIGMSLLAISVWIMTEWSLFLD